MEAIGSDVRGLQPSNNCNGGWTGDVPTQRRSIATRDRRLGATKRSPLARLRAQDAELSIGKLNALGVRPRSRGVDCTNCRHKS